MENTPTPMWREIDFYLERNARGQRTIKIEKDTLPVPCFVCVERWAPTDPPMCTRCRDRYKAGRLPIHPNWFR